MAPASVAAARSRTITTPYITNSWHQLATVIYR